MVGPAPSSVNARLRDRVLRAARKIDETVGWRAAIWGALLALLALVLDFVPLFDLLGYDFSFALGLGAALAGVDIGHGVVVRWRARHPGERPGPGAAIRLVARALVTALAALAAPLALSLVNALRVRNCNLLAGLGFFFLLPVGTVLYAAPAGVLAGLAVAARRRGRLLAFAVPLVSGAWALLRLYRQPAVFAFDPFGGYFPGPIYDEALRPPLRLLGFRLVNLSWMATAVVIGLAAVGRGRDPRRWRLAGLLAAAPLVAASVALFALQGRMGTAVRRPDLERALDRALRTQHFVVRYASSTGKSRTDLGLLAEDLEFRYHQLTETLGVEPAGPITVWQFPNADEKKALVGAGHTLYARPWSREIFLQGDRFPLGPLRHEMAHVFAGAFGDRAFGISLAVRWKGPLPVPTLAMGLVEGVAEAADYGDPDGETTIHQDAAAMIADGRAPPLAAVVGAGFSAQAGARAYTVAGSFCAWLLETRGAERLRALYASAGDFDAVYRTPLATLEGEWRQFLARQPLAARDRARAQERFRRPAIFKKVCARELAARVVEARSLERSEPAEAVRLLESTCDDDPGEPTFRLELAQALALAGDVPRALETVGRLGGDPQVSSPLRAQAASLSAEIRYHAGDAVNAAADVQRVLALAPDDADRRQAWARSRALATPAARETLGRALFGDVLGGAGADPVLTFYLLTEYARLAPEEKLGPYLVGRQLLARDPRAALTYLSRACDAAPGAGTGAAAAAGTAGNVAAAAGAGSPGGAAGALPSEFRRECWRMTADAAYRVGDFARARAALDALAGAAPGEADRLRAVDMLARVAWAQARRVSRTPAP